MSIAHNSENEPKLSYFICTTPRSGSTMLCYGIESTGLGGIASGTPHELFLPLFRKEISACLQTYDIDSYIKSIKKRFMTSNGIFGTKIMWRDFSKLLKEISENFKAKKISDLELLKQTFGDVRFIYLKRLNKLEQAISISRAIQSGIWHLKAESKKEKVSMESKKARDEFSFLKILHYKSSLEVNDQCWENFFKNNDIKPLLLVYEELIDDFASKIYQVLNYLDKDIKRVDISVNPQVEKLADSRSKDWADKFLKINKRFFWLEPFFLFLARLNIIFRMYRFKSP
ncbi:MAG: hypothetical protein JW867_08645 [Candidatus Omnitrophica bacterium]|nr:hypothetical protein [Candidatus Omnitrophota bacterium]